MINSISKRIAQRWLTKKYITNNDYELYHYGLFIILTNIELFMFTLLLGVLLKNIIPSIVFFVTFFSIRRFAGGFHAKTELHCQIISLSFLSFSIVVIKYLTIYVNYRYLLVINLTFVIILYLFSPADTPQKPLLEDEKKLFKKVTGIIGVSFLILNCILLYFNIKSIAVATICAFVLESTLVIFGRIFNYRLNEN